MNENKTPPYLIESKSKLHSYITLTEILTATARLPYLWKGDSVVIGKRTTWGQEEGVANGCGGTRNHWHAWPAVDSQTSSVSG